VVLSPLAPGIVSIMVILPTMRFGCGLDGLMANCAAA
jgi:hypothetical protein